MTGTPVWYYRPDAPISASAVLTADRKLIFPTENGTIYGFDLSKNPTPSSYTWIREFGDSVVLAPAIDAENNIIVVTNSGRILKLYFGAAGLVVTRWNTIIGKRITTSPVIDGNGFIYVGCEDGMLKKIDPNSGEIIWEYNSGSNIKTTPAISEYGRLYFGNIDGIVSCIDTMGHKIWQYENAAPVNANMLHIKGTTYVGTYDGYVHSFYDGGGSIPTSTLGKKLESLPKSPVWGTFQGNNRRTGSAQDNGIATGIKNEVAVPNHYVLMQNYPNPFNPSTMIKYGIPEQSNVKIEIFNMLGQSVGILVNCDKSAGFYETAWNAENLPSGIYLISIKANGISSKKNFTQVKKSLLLK